MHSGAILGTEKGRHALQLRWIYISESRCSLGFRDTSPAAIHADEQGSFLAHDFKACLEYRLAFDHSLLN